LTEPARTHLRDGSLVVIRPIEPADQELLRARVCAHAPCDVPIAREAA
jgi:hypothetical protein